MISNADYVHLHCHSEFSRFDGLAKIDDFTLTAKLMGFPAIAITDHGNVGGWIKFWASAKKKKKYKVPLDYSFANAVAPYTVKKITDEKSGREIELEVTIEAALKPILGEEFYLSRRHEMGGKEGNPDGRKGNRHILLLAKNVEGYKNLCTLSQRSWTHGQYIDPRIDLNLLAEHSKGIICSTACLGSVVNNNLLHGRYAQAKKVATLLKDIFGKDLYISTMYHGIDHEGNIVPDQIKLGKELDIPVVAENDCHMCRKEQARSQELLMAMSTSRCIKDPKRIHFPYSEFYIKSAAEMHKVFGHYPEILTNTRMIAERIEDTVKPSTMRLPKFDIEKARETAVILSTPIEEDAHEKGKKFLDEILDRKVVVTSAGEVESSDDTFEKAYSFMIELAEKGMRKLKWHKSEAHMKALKLELTDIRVAWESNRMDFATYFLIVWDYINFARSKKILTGCGRGSGYASLVLRCLGITYGPDPIRYGLIWERFLGFSDSYFLNDHDWGFDEADETAVTAEITDTSEDDLLEEREVEDDLGGVDRY